MNPAQTTDYGRSLGRRLKTDKADAKLLASFGAERHLEASQPPDEAQEHLKALRRHKEWLGAQAQATRNRLEAAQHSPWTPPSVTRSLQQTLKDLERQVQETQEALDRLVAEDERWQWASALLDS
ncbi:MAG: transposase, partial [Chloroflexi bacterium]|nr:transposase [Chloroflexota bacterium]